VTVEVPFGFGTGIREDVLVLFGPAEIGVIAGVLVGAVTGAAVTVVVEVLSVAVPAANGGVVCAQAFSSPKAEAGDGRRDFLASLSYISLIATPAWYDSSVVG